MLPLRELEPGVWRVRSSGSERPLVCLPGFLGDARVFAPLASLCGRDLWAFDLPRVGYEELLGELQARLDVLGPCDLLTGSFGGLLARGLGGTCSLATVGTLPSRRWLEDGVRARRRLLAALPAPLVEALYRRHTRRAAIEDELSEELARALAERALPKAALLERLAMIERWPFPPPPAVPTLHLHGAGDPQVRWSPEDLGGEVAVVPGRHRPHASHPRELLERLERFWWAARLR